MVISDIMHTSFLNRWWFWPIFIGLVVRLVLMPITYHPDLLGHSSVAFFLAQEGVANPYDHLANLPAEHPLVKNFGVSDIFIYPPLTYFTLGTFRLLVKPFTNPDFIPEVWQDPGELLDRGDLFWHLFIFKLPYVFFDVGSAFLLAGLFNVIKQKTLVVWLWMLNPLAIYATFMLGQLDLLPTFFVVLALYMAKRSQANLALLSLGIGASFKMFPILFVIPLACYLTKSLGGRLKLVFLGVLPFILTVGPFLATPAFREMVLFSPKSQKMLFMVWKMTSAEGIYPFVLFLAFIYLASFYLSKINIYKVFLGILILIFSVTHYHPQWFLWLTPLLVIEMVNSQFKYWFIHLTLFTTWLVLTLFFEPSLSIGLFAPLSKNMAEAVGFAKTLSPYTDIFQLTSLVRTVFAAFGAFLVYHAFSVKSQTRTHV